MASPGRLRALAPLIALVLPVVLLGAAWQLWSRWPCGTSVCAGPMTAVWGLVLLALPTALLLGLPWTAGPVTIGATVASSALVWLALGRVAALRATQDVDARWRDVLLELGVLTAAVWAGLVSGLGALVVVLTR